jgi:phospholipase/carboxylesterase
MLAVGCAAPPPARSTPPLAVVERTIGRGSGPILVMLHGYGSMPEHFLGLADRTDLPSGTLLVLPRAPLPIPGFDHGTMWWPLPPDLASLPHARPPGLDSARAAVAGLLDDQSARHPGRPIVLGGFSQGAITTLDLALHDARPLAGIALLSGTLVDETETDARLASRRDLPIYLSHGTHDDVLAYADDARLVEHMRAHGLDVDFTTFDGGHVVTPEVSTDLAAFVTRVTR